MGAPQEGGTPRKAAPRFGNKSLVLSGPRQQPYQQQQQQGQGPPANAPASGSGGFAGFSLGSRRQSGMVNGHADGFADGGMEEGESVEVTPRPAAVSAFAKERLNGRLTAASAPATPFKAATNHVIGGPSRGPPSTARPATVGKPFGKVVTGGRDKLRAQYIAAGLMLDSEAQVHLDQAVDFKGDCMEMCPEFEIHEREYQSALSVFEKPLKIEGTDRADPAKCVKKYKRSAAGDKPPMPCDVRPPEILISTLDYLFHVLIREHGLEATYEFVRDRCRAIRTDFTLQNSRGPEAVECHERIARFHIYCCYKYMGTPHEGMELEQMRKTLQSLSEFYEDLNLRGVASPNEAEFQAYYILSHMGQNDVVTNMETQLPPEVYDDPRVQQAIDFQQMAQTMRNRRAQAGSLAFYTRYFRKMASPSTPLLVACLLYMEVWTIRTEALRGMHTRSHYLEPKTGYFPVVDLVEKLGFDDEEETVDFLKGHGIEVVEVEGMYRAAIGKEPKKARPLFTEFSGKRPASLSKTLVEPKYQGMDLVDFFDGKAGQEYHEESAAAPVPARRTSVRASSLPMTLKVEEGRSRQSTGKLQPVGQQPTQPAAISFGTLNKPALATTSPRLPTPTDRTGLAPPSAYWKDPPNIHPSLRVPEFKMPPPTMEAPAATAFEGFGRLIAVPAEANPPSLVSLAQQSVVAPQGPVRPFGGDSVEMPQTVRTPQVFAPLIIGSGSGAVAAADPTPPTPRGPEMVQIVQTLIDEETEAVCRAFLAEDAAARSAADRLEDEVAGEMVEELCEEVVADIEAMETEAAAQRCRGVFYKWFNGALARAQWRMRERRERQERAVRFYLNVLGSDVSTGVAGGPAGRRGKVVAKGFGGDGLGAAGDADICRVMAEFLDLGDVIGGPLLKSSPRENHVRWKLVVSTPPSDAGAGASNGNGSFASAFIRSKFGPADSSSKMIEHAGGVRVHHLTRVDWARREEVYDNKSKGGVTRGLVRRTATMCVSHVDAPGPAVYPLKTNAESAASGAKAALFQFTVVEDWTDISQWWEKERSRLYAFLACLPRGSEVPLQMVYWPVDELPLKAFLEQGKDKLNLVSILADSGGPVSAIDVIAIEGGGRADAIDFEGAMKELRRGLVWLAEKAGPDPVVHSDVIRDVISTHTADIVRFAANKMDEAAPDDDFALDLTANADTFNAMVDLFNAQLDVVESLFSPASANIPYPAREFATGEDPRIPPIPWNSERFLSVLPKMISQCRLPHMEVPSKPGYVTLSAKIGAVKEMYESYVHRLMIELPDTSSNTASGLLASLWSRIAPFEVYVLNGGVGRGGVASGPRPERFPFSNLLLACAGVSIAALEKGLTAAARQLIEADDAWVAKGDEEGAPASYWYDYGAVAGCVQGFRQRANGIVIEWEGRVVEEWRRTLEYFESSGEEDVDELEHDDVEPVHHDEDADERDDERFVRPRAIIADKTITASGRKPNGSSPPTPYRSPPGSVLAPSSSATSSPTKRKASDDDHQEGSRYRRATSLDGRTPMHIRGPEPEGRAVATAAGDEGGKKVSAYEALKRRLSEAIKGAKEEVEISKRNIQEGDGRDNQVYNAVGTREVVGCIPVCQDGRIVLVNSRRHPENFILPKGGAEKDESFAESARREAWEEGGVKGRIDEESRLQAIPHAKGLKGNKEEPKCMFHFFTLYVDEVADTWPEDQIRKRKIVTVEEAEKLFAVQDDKPFTQALQQWRQQKHGWKAA
ncbi:hypothetical protein HK101_009657 [Irineochytrium annulatum]|nr:hypothetical protein HK101_009657 [Irineochytrium annulatum]